MYPRVEIILLKYKSPELESRCLNSIIENTECPYRLTVWDNRHNPCHMSKQWNQLIRESHCEYVCIMDTDVEVPPRWLSDLMYSRLHLEAHEKKVSVLVPATENVGSPAQLKRDQGLIPVGMVSPVVGLYERSIFRTVGFFDEREEFAFFGQDSEWIVRANRKGYQAYVETSVFVSHVGNGSTGKAHDDGELDLSFERERAGAAFREAINNHV